MSKFLVETHYNCTFKITHELDELNEKALADIDNRKDGSVEIINVTVNNRKTKKASDKKVSKKIDLPNNIKIDHVNNKSNLIPSNEISMSESDGKPLEKGKIKGTGTTTGKTKIMKPGKNYKFPGDKSVLETPACDYCDGICNMKCK